MPGPVKVVYEAGPTGYGLFRHLNDHGVTCVVVATSKLQRPAGGRVKTDAKDAALLARLLKLDEIVEVTVPSVQQETVRDLVRAREDVRGDLMRSRHRLSKMLLRQGILYTGGRPWTGGHDRWLQSQRFGLPDQQLAYDAAYEAVVLTLDRGTGSMRRSRRWRRQQRHPAHQAAVLPTGDLDVDRVRVGGRDR